MYDWLQSLCFFFYPIKQLQNASQEENDQKWLRNGVPEGAE